MLDTPSLPGTQSERIPEAVYLAEDPDLDRLTSLAVRLLGAPVSLITEIGDAHQHFRSQCGLPEPLATERETPLSQSLCHHVVVSDAPLVLEDTASDPAYRGHGATTELGVGAYLGVPIRSSSGRVVGSLCVLSWEPRAWSEDDILAVRDLAALAERIVGRRAQRLQAIFDASFQFMGLMRPDGTLVEINQPALDFGGVSPEEVIGKPAWETPWFSHSERAQADLRVAVARAARGEFVRYEVEVCGADGACVPIDFSIKPVFERERVVLLIPEGRLLSEEVRALHMQEALQAGLTGTWTMDFATDTVVRHGSVDAIFGLPPEEGPRRVADYLARVHPEDAGGLRFAIARAVSTRTPFNAQFRVVHPDGQVRRVSIYGEVLVGEDGRLASITGALTDVTAREAAEAALLRAEELRELALTAVGMGAWAWNFATDEVEADGRVHALLGMEPGTFHTVDDLYRRVHPDDLPALREVLRQATEGREDFEHEFRVRGEEGGYRWIAGKGRLLPGSSGEPGWLVGVNFDVTEQHQAREALLESEARFRRLAEALPQIVFIVGPGGAIEYLNDRWYTFAGQHRAEGERPALWEAVHPEDRPVLDEVWAEARAEGQPLDLEARLRGRDGDYRWFLFRSVPLYDEAGGIVRWFGAATDIHLQKAVEATLERRVAERTAELDRSNQELDQFAYVASHDLKAPLRGIANLATWIEEDAGHHLPPDSRRHLDLLLGRVERMERLLDDLLAYSRIGRTEAEPEPLDSGDVVRGIVDLLAPPPGFTVQTGGTMPPLVTARAPFEGVLRNLIHNAIKHHHESEGTITVSATDAGDGFVAFAVADDGPGIDPAYHDRVFGLFQTLRPRDEVEGSGMGLAYVKKAVEAHGGTVCLTSEPGHGATFHFTWPAAPPPPPPDSF